MEMLRLYMQVAQLVNRRRDCEGYKRKVWRSGTMYSKLTEDQQHNCAYGDNPAEV